MNSKRINPFGDDEDEDFSGPSAWGAPKGVSAVPLDRPLSGLGSKVTSTPFGEGASDILKDTIRKEAVIRDIFASQGDLKALQARIQSVQSEVDKLRSGNQTLQMYIENLTKQASKR
ncbi:hypothetical protein FRB94_010648 [Tulasnella sp. JGI-2019a]|nr:hypothetical protein FRB94_010648 [Tulasnella sp. JGI-2019a]KAG9011329.1 hypothetical protein FRB93_003131 [Tulasnella sp. JGI-2019a]KAG9037386.1 hypothetical protein FRB95_005675 [Tulasnella sp. JGI-2019a]